MAVGNKRTSVYKIALLITFALTFVLSGCSSKTGSGDNTKPAVNQSGTDSGNKADNTGGGQADASEGNKAADTSEFVKLTWYMPPPIDPRPNEKKVMQMLNDILKEKINANLEIKFVDFATYAQKIKVSSAAGEEFDLFSDFNLLGFSQNVSNGLAMELDDLLNKYGQDIVKKVPEQAWGAVTSEGRKFGIANPSAWISSANISIRKDIADKYSIDYASIHTYEDLEPVLQMLKEKEPSLIPFTGTFLIPQTMDMISPLVGYDTTDGKWKSQLDNPEWTRTTKLQNSWFMKGYLPKKVIPDAVTEFKTGRYAASTYHVYDSSFVKMSTEFGTPMVATPLDFKNVVTGGSVRSAVTYVSKTSKHAERAMMLINLLYKDKDFFNRFAYGIEGDDWEYVSGKDTDNPTIKTKDQLGWAIWHPWIASLWDQWPSNWNSQEVLDGLKSAIDKAEYSPFVGFTFDSSPVKKELAQIDALEPEIKTIFMAKDLDAKIAEYQAKIKGAGLDKVIAEIEKQVAAWKEITGK